MFSTRQKNLSCTKGNTSQSVMHVYGCVCVCVPPSGQHSNLLTPTHNTGRHWYGESMKLKISHHIKQ